MSQAHRQQSSFARALQAALGSASVSDSARKLALDLLFREAIRQPPVQPRRLAERLGIPVVYEEMGADGVLRGWPEHPELVVRNIGGAFFKSEQRRQNFTLAHELGHLVVRSYLASAKPALNFVVESRDEERFCDAFASELLMPHMMFVADVHQHGVSPRACLSLADKYEVSLTALLNRVSCFCRRGHEFIAILWSFDDDARRPSVHWSAPTYARRVHLTDALLDYLRSAAATRKDEPGEQYLFDGKKRRLWRLSSRLLADSRRMLTIGVRGDCPFEFKVEPRAIPDHSTVARRTTLSNQLGLWSTDIA